jgi:hypothetical protein
MADASLVWLFADSFIYRLPIGLPVLWRVRYLQGFIRNKAVLFSDCVLLLQPCHLPINPQKRSAYILQRVRIFLHQPSF